MCPMVRRPPGIELALLGFLRDGPQHGYQIYLLVSDPNGLGQVWRLKQSQLYALLAKLEKDGFIKGELKIQEEAHPPRRIYHLTQTGQSVYKNWLKQPVKVPHLIRQEFMAKYYFARQEGKEQVKELLDAQRAACRQWLEKMSPPGDKQISFNSLIYQYRIGQINSVLTWLETCQQELRQDS